jgi:hypothetical protein
MHLGVGEEQPERCLVRAQPLLDLGDGQPLAGRPALMEAEVALSIELAAVAKDADFLIVDEHDLPITVLEFRTLSDKFLGHAHNLPSSTLRAGAEHEAKGNAWML